MLIQGLLFVFNTLAIKLTTSSVTTALFVLLQLILVGVLSPSYTGQSKTGYGSETILLEVIGLSVDARTSISPAPVPVYPLIGLPCGS